MPGCVLPAQAVAAQPPGTQPAATSPIHGANLHENYEEHLASIRSANQNALREMDRLISSLNGVPEEQKEQAEEEEESDDNTDSEDADESTDDEQCFALKRLLRRHRNKAS